MRESKLENIPFEILYNKIHDANYIWTEDPFAPDFLRVVEWIKMGPVYDPSTLKYKLPMHKPFGEE